MHTIEFPNGGSLGEMTFSPGCRYLVEDHNAAQFMIGGGARVNFAEAPDDLDATADWNGKRILIVRCGALGDLLMLTPSLREIKRRWPACHITFATFPRYRAALEGNPHVDAFIDYPVLIPNPEAAPIDAVVWLENAIESHPYARSMPVIDALARRFGIEDLPDKSLVWNWQEGEESAAVAGFPRTGCRRVGIQCRASAAYKTYPKEAMDRAAQLLFLHGWEVFLFGHPGEINAPTMDRLVNVSALKCTVRESAAIAATCDVLLSADSFMVHLAAALRRPCVALFGPFPANLYTAHYPLCHAITGNGPCAPCFHHPRGMHFPREGLCQRSGRCEVLGDINPRAVVKKVEEVYEQHKN